MVVPSGIVLPGDEPLALREVVKGLYVAQSTDAYARDYGFFSQSPLYRKEPLVPEAELEEGKADLKGECGLR